jgi:hypothetical protein
MITEFSILIHLNDDTVVRLQFLDCLHGDISTKMSETKTECGVPTGYHLPAEQNRGQAFR